MASKRAESLPICQLPDMGWTRVGRGVPPEHLTWCEHSHKALYRGRGKPPKGSGSGCAQLVGNLFKYRHAVGSCSEDRRQCQLECQGSEINAK